MNTNRLRMTVALLCIAVALTACQTRKTNPPSASNAGTANQNTLNAKGVQNTDDPSRASGVTQGHNMHDAAVIPSQLGPKTHSTNEHGGTSSGLGTSVYSLIGSSGLHSAGFSSHLESRLSADGLDGVKVFVVDDMVVLAAETRQASGTQYDAMQQKVLSPYGGLSGRGPEPASPQGTVGTLNAADDNLSRAAAKVQQFMGGSVQVKTVVGKQGVETINRIRANAGSPQAMAGDIRTLLQLAAESK